MGVENDHVRVKHLAEFSTPAFYGSGWQVATFMNYDVQWFGLLSTSLIQMYSVFPHFRVHMLDL
jgi:hypothetical protein